MKRVLPFFLLFAAVAISVSSCKKDDDDDAATPDPTPTTSVICDGNGSNSYYPLKASNSWHYSDGSSNSFTNTVTGTATYGANTYFEVEGTLGGVMRLRQAANGDIMAYNSSTSSEYLYVPAAGTAGQTWSYTLELATTRKVVSTSATFTTGSCSYTGLVQIQNLSSTGAVQHTYYYKKGVGMISTDQIWGGVIITKLTSVTLN